MADAASVSAPREAVAEEEGAEPNDGQGASTTGSSAVHDRLILRHGRGALLLRGGEGLLRCEGLVVR